MLTKVSTFEKPEIRLEHLVDGEWKVYCWLVSGSDKLGHYGAAKDAWDYANNQVKSNPKSWRIRYVNVGNGI